MQYAICTRYAICRLPAERYLSVTLASLKVKVLVTQSCPALCNTMAYSHQAPLSMEFFRQEYWTGSPFPSPGDLTNTGIEPRCPALQADSLLSEPLGKPLASFSSVQFSSVQLCLTVWDSMNLRTPGLPVHHQLTEFTQTHVHQVSDAIQPSHPLSSPSPPAPNPSQHQGLFQ